MIEKKHFDKVIIFLMVIAVIICGVGVYCSDLIKEKYDDSGISMEYETALFDTSEPICINIDISEDDWNAILEEPLSETYYSCNVDVNGTEFSDVGIRTKGNTSLSNIANDDTTDRYSFKLEFDHYIDGQSCFGLDKLVLNNNYADVTNMKEAIVYDMFQFLDADASLYNYAKVCINGEYWGVYLALEAVEESFQLRNYGVSSGDLYKPENMEMQDKGDENMQPFGNGEKPDMQNMQPPTDGEKPDMQNMQPPTDGEKPNMQNMQPPGNSENTDSQSEQVQDNADFRNNIRGKGDMMSGNGSDLNYTDDELDSYSAIWDGEVQKTGKKDHARVVEALKNISEGNDLEKYMDVDNVLKYMAVHTFAVNLDSLSGNMEHNYYLYEENGQLNMIPWDYNLSWGGFQSGAKSSASETINFPIDTPFSENISLEDRQFFAALLENDTYLEQYHSYLQQLCDEYINGGKLDETYQNIRAQIDSLVETDPTAFYTYDEYDQAADLLYEVLKLRAESISGQLSGTIPSTTEGQKTDSESLIDASDIDLSVLGTMQGAMKQGGVLKEE